MNTPNGYTKIDLIVAFAIFLIAAIVIVLIGNPGKLLKRQNDRVREEGTRDVMEIMLEMFYDDSESFAAMLGPAAAGRTMIGTGESCEGDFGSQCGDDVLRDSCLDLAEHAVPDYINALPIDPRGSVYSADQTGYYLEFKDSTLYVGACNPEAREEIVLWNRF
ncbi:MAG: hypothetical protein ABIA47_03320 [bacterium]